MAEGKIGIRVFPDTKNFRKELLTTLRRVEKQVKLNIGANLDPARRDINRMIADLRKIKPEIHIDADLEDAKERIEEIAQDLRATVNVDADTAVARAKLTAAARPRIVLFIAKMNQSSLANISKALAALSGARVAGDYLKRVGESLSNLDRNLPRLAAISLAVANIGAAALASVQGTLSLGAALASISGAGLVLPALFAAIGTSMVTVVLALKDAKTELASLAPAFKDLQSSVSASFWEQAKQPILDLARTVLPSLKAGLTDVSASLGGFTAALASAIQQTLTAGVMDDLFRPLALSIDIARKAMLPLVQAFTTLGTVGGSYLPRLAQWFVVISQRFNDWVQASAANGDMFRWIETGITSLKALGRVVVETGRILGGLFKAAQNAGSGNGLVTLADNLGKIADIVNREPFSGALTQIFLGAGEAMRGLGKALGPIGDMFVALAPSIRQVLSVAGNALGNLLTNLADALSSPVFSKGLEGLFEGLKVGLDAVGPALGPLADAFGTVAKFAGKLAAQLGPVLGTAIEVLAPVIEELLNALEPLIPVLGDALIQVFKDLSPVLSSIVDLIPPIVDAFIQLLPSVIPLVGPLLQMAAAIIQLLVPALQFLLPLIVGLAQFLINLITPILSVGGAVATFIQAFVQAGVQTALATTKIGQVITNMVRGVIQGFVSLVTTVVSAVTTLWSRVVATFNQLRANAASVWNGIKSSISNAINSALSTVRSVVSRILSSLRSSFESARSTASSVWNGITSTIRGAINNAVNAVRSIGGRIRGALSGAGSWLVSAGRDIVNGMIRGVQAMIGRLASIVRQMARSAVNAAKSVLNINSPSRVFRDEVGRMIPAGIEDGITRGQSSLTRTLHDLVQIPDIEAPGYVGSAPVAAPGGSGGEVNVYTADPYVAAKEVVRLQKLGGL